MRDLEPTLLQSCYICDLAWALSVECLRKSCKLQLDVSRVVCPVPHTYQASLAFAVRSWCPEVGLLNLLSQALNKRTGVLCCLLCCRVGSLSRLEFQGLDTAGLLVLRPSRAGLQEERCPAVSCSTAVLPRKKARQDLDPIHQQRGFHLLSRPRAGTDTHVCPGTGSHQHEHAGADSHEFAVQQAHPRQHRCKQSRAGAGLLAVIEADVFIFA